MRFADVRHQGDAIEALQRGLRAARTPHAYIFSGPEGVGKEMTATRFAALLLCSQSTSEVRGQRSDVGGQKSEVGDQRSEVRSQDACGTCADCVMMAAGTHPDFQRIHSKLNKHHPDSLVRNRKATTLSVEVIRHFVIDKVSRRPARGRAQVFVIADAEKMQDAAQNALLKTLEEPPGSSYLILLTPSGAELLPTVRSRCQVVAFRGLPVEFVVDELMRNHGADEAAARFVAEMAQGRLGLAARYVHEAVFQRVAPVLGLIRSSGDDPLGCGKALADMARDMAKKGGAAAADDDEGDEDEEAESADEAEKTAAAGKSSSPELTAARAAQSTLFAVVSTLLRDVLRAAAGADPVGLPADRTIRELGAAADAVRVGAAIKAVADAEYQIGRSVNVSLVFDSVGIAVGRAVRGSAMS